MLRTAFVSLAVIFTVVAFFWGAQTTTAKWDNGGLNPDSSIQIESPINAKTYDKNSLTLNVTVGCLFGNFSIYTDLNYRIDDGNLTRIPVSCMTYTIDYAGYWTSPNTLTVCVQLPPLSDGCHVLTVYFHYPYIVPTLYGSFYTENWVTFTVDGPPAITILSIQNQTYTTNNLPLEFTSNKEASCMGYSLDDQAAVTINGNTTLADLSNGPHSIIVYVNSTLGSSGQSETVDFIVELSKIEQIIDPGRLETAIVVVGALAFGAILVTGLEMFRKRKGGKTGMSLLSS